MIKQLLYSKNNWNGGILLIRIMTGIFILKYGLELFDKNQINNYTAWLTDVHFPMPKFMTYVGKATEFIAGILLFADFLPA